MLKGNIKNYSQELLDEVRSKNGTQEKAIRILNEGNKGGNLTLIADTSFNSSGWTALHWSAYKRWNTLLRKILDNKEFHEECLRVSSPPWFWGYLRFLGIFNGNQTPAHVACLKTEAKPTLLAIKTRVFNGGDPEKWAQYYHQEDALGKSLAIETEAESLAPIGGNTIFSPTLEHYKSEHEEYDQKITDTASVLKNGTLGQVVTHVASSFGKELGLSPEQSKTLAAKGLDTLSQHSDKFAAASKQSFGAFALNFATGWLHSKADPGDEKASTKNTETAAAKAKLAVLKSKYSPPLSPRPGGAKIAKVQFSPALETKGETSKQSSNKAQDLATFVSSLGGYFMPR